MEKVDTAALEAAQRTAQAEINSAAAERQSLEAKYGQVWDTSQLREDFEVIGFGAPIVEVRRRSDGVKGSLFFQHNPRYYWGFEPS